MDAHVCAMDGVMLCYTDHRKRVSVPAAAMRMPLRLLGMASLCVPNAERVTVEEGYTAISAGALIQPQEGLAEVTLPSTLKTVKECVASPPRLRSYPPRLHLRRRISEAAWDGLLEHSIPVGQDFRLLDPVALASDPFRLLSDLLAAQRQRIISGVDLDLPLFFWQKDAERSVFVPLECMWPGSAAPRHTEDEGVRARIASGDMGRRNPSTERMIDRMDQRGVSFESVETQKRTFVGFNEAACVHKGGEVFMTLTAMTGVFFNQLLRRVACEGATYYVYSRRFPSENPAEYRREDVCVYGPDGLVTDPALSNRVYSKYRLLNMI